MFWRIKLIQKYLKSLFLPPFCAKERRQRYVQKKKNDPLFKVQNRLREKRRRDRQSRVIVKIQDKRMKSRLRMAKMRSLRKCCQSPETMQQDS